MSRTPYKWLRVCLAVAVTAACGIQQLAAAVPDVQPANALSAGVPDWYSPSVHRSVMAAEAKGVPAPPLAAAQSIGFMGIRPGSWIISPNWCTANYVFSASGAWPGSGPFYIGTAKHCVQEQRSVSDGGGFDPNEVVVGKPVVMLIARADGKTPLQLLKVGNVAFATAGNGTVGNDYALIQIDDALVHLISPSIAGVGGPTSVHTSGADGSPVVLQGNGVAIGTGGSARPGVLTQWVGTNGFGMLAPAVPGDSGAPVRTVGGAAVGSATHIRNYVVIEDNKIRPHIDNPTSYAYGTSVSLPRTLWGVKVVTCPSGIPWPLAGCPSI